MGEQAKIDTMLPYCSHFFLLYFAQIPSKDLSAYVFLLPEQIYIFDTPFLFLCMCLQNKLCPFTSEFKLYEFYHQISII